MVLKQTKKKNRFYYSYRIYIYLFLRVYSQIAFQTKVPNLLMQQQNLKYRCVVHDCNFITNNQRVAKYQARKC